MYVTLEYNSHMGQIGIYISPESWIDNSDPYNVLLAIATTFATCDCFCDPDISCN